MSQITPEQTKACLVLRDILRDKREALCEEICDLKMRGYDCSRKNDDESEKEIEHIAGQIYQVENSKRLLLTIEQAFTNNIKVDENKEADYRCSTCSSCNGIFRNNLGVDTVKCGEQNRELNVSVGEGCAYHKPNESDEEAD